jgi:8-oxo-dGTP diphosphatase
MMRDFLLRLWLRQRGGVQWRLLWLFNSKFMASVAGVVSNDAGQLLILRHRYHAGSGWGLPGGIVHAGEHLEEALAREICEETGYTIAGFRLIEVISGYQMRLEAYYQAHLTGGTLRLQESEILEAGFFLPDALPPGIPRVQQKIINDLAKF